LAGKGDNTAKGSKHLLKLAACYVCKRPAPKRFSKITHKGGLGARGRGHPAPDKVMKLKKRNAIRKRRSWLYWHRLADAFKQSSARGPEKLLLVRGRNKTILQEIDEWL
jgi:hypothetical protein